MTSAVFYFYADKEIGNSFRLFHIDARNFLDYLLPAILISASLGFVIAIGIAIYFPHTLAGPIFRIENDLKKLAGKDLTFRFRLREGDHFQDLADTLGETKILFYYSP